MGTLSWYLPKPNHVRPIVVSIRCEYPDGQELTEVRFVAHPSLGRTPREVSQEILARMARAAEFELPAAGEGIPFPFWSETVRRIAVW